MQSNPYSTHLDEQVHSADPVELVAMLYGALEGAIQRARGCLRNRDAAGRARQISHAMAILAELGSSLDQGNGGALAGNLAALYAFLIEKLRQAHVQQAEKPLEEALRVLEPLSDAWRHASRARTTLPFAPAGEAAIPASLSYSG